MQQAATRTGEWITCTRKIRADWRPAVDSETLHGVALMTGADHSASWVAARYGRIGFCSTPACGGIEGESPCTENCIGDF